MSDVSEIVVGVALIVAAYFAGSFPTLELIATLLAPVLICGHREGTLSVIGQNGLESIGAISLNNNLLPCVPKLMSDLT